MDLSDALGKAGRKSCNFPQFFCNRFLLAMSNRCSGFQANEFRRRLPGVRSLSSCKPVAAFLSNTSQRLPSSASTQLLSASVWTCRYLATAVRVLCPPQALI